MLRLRLRLPQYKVMERLIHGETSLSVTVGVPYWWRVIFRQGN